MYSQGSQPYTRKGDQSGIDTESRISTKSVREGHNMRELTQSCHDVRGYPTGTKVMASECPILHVVIADQDSKCQDSSGVRDEHIHAIHDQSVMEKMFR